MDISTIVSTILFLGPGFFVLKLDDEICSNGNRFDSSEEHILKAFIDSFLILLINLKVIKTFTNIKLLSMTYFVSKFDTIDFFIKYVGLTFLTSVLYAVFIKRFFGMIFLIIKNCYINSKIKECFNEIDNKIYKFLDLKVRESTFPTIWESIFCDNPKDLLCKIITIEKDGNILSCGYIGEIPRKNGDNKELKIINSNEISKYMYDEEFTQHYIDTIEFEYYDLDSGTLIKCYRLIEDAFNKYNDSREEKSELKNSV